MGQQASNGHDAIVGRQDMWRYGREGGVLALGSLLASSLATWRHGSGGCARTVGFDALVLGQMLHTYFCRSDRPHGVFNGGLPSNASLNQSVAVSLALQLAAHLVPSLRRLLGIAPLDVLDLATVAAGATLPLFVNQQSKRPN